MKKLLYFYLLGGIFLSCNTDLLHEDPLILNSDNVLVSQQGFENYITALHYGARDELAKYDYLPWYMNLQIGTDVINNGEKATPNFKNWETFLTPVAACVERYWHWAYADMLPRANSVIIYADKPENAGIWASTEQKNAVIAEAKFFRAYVHNLLANLYGGVPIVDTIFSGPKTDFVRNSRQEVYDFARQDLEFAAQWLPATVDKQDEGRIVKAAADHLLTEVNISLGQYDKAVESASRVINSGLYKLMTERFGAKVSEPGDAYSDLFRTGNHNRSSGNLESIYVWQFEDQIPGGYSTTNTGGNPTLRYWVPFYVNVRDPDGKPGMVVADSLGRGVGLCRPTNYFLYDLWRDDWNNDMRNSPHNIRRTYYYNNPASAYFGQVVQKEHIQHQDTFQMIYPTIRKVEGEIGWLGRDNPVRAGLTSSDFIVYRLAETYLLRAEAHLKNGDLISAAADINKVRERAHAKAVAPENVDLDYILDERARELIAEEPRHRTLVRTGKLVERVRKHAMLDDTRTTIQDYHEFWPIPQVAIDANISVKLEQNPGYSN